MVVNIELDRERNMGNEKSNQGQKEDGENGKLRSWSKV